MTEFQAFADVQGGRLRLKILSTDAVRSSEVQCVLDLTDFGEVVGVEVLDLSRQLDGGTITPPPGSGQITWSYDAEIDALYIHVADGRGQVQRSALANAETDAAGRLVALTIPIPEVS